MHEGAHAEAQDHRRDDTRAGDDERAAADREHAGDGRLEADLEEQHDRAELRQQQQRLAVQEPAQARQAHEREVPQHEAGRQLAQHRRLADALEERAAHLGQRDHEREHEQQQRDRLVRAGRGQEHAADPNLRRNP